MFYLFLSAFILFVSFKLFKIASGSLSFTKLNMISWVFYYNIVLQSFIAALLVLYELDHHYFISKMYSNTSRIYGYYAVMYTMVALPLGMILYNKVATGSFYNKYFENYLDKPVVNQFRTGEPVLRGFLYLLSIICILSVIYVFISMRSFPLLSALMGNSSSQALDEIRGDASRKFEGIIYIRNIFGLFLTPLLSYIFYVYSRITKDRRIKNWFLIMVVFSLLILTYNLEKSPILLYIIGFMFIKILLNDRMNFRKLMKIVFLILIILFSIYIFILGQPIETLFNYNSGFIGRLILGQSAGTYLSFDLFPKYEDFIGFDSISRFVSSLIDSEYKERSGRLIMQFYNPRGIDDGTAGVTNSLFIGEAWANFGLIGVILSPFYVGFIIQFINLYLLKSRKTPIYIGVLGFLCYSIPVTGGLNDFIYNPVYFFVFLIFGFLISLAKTHV